MDNKINEILKQYGKQNSEYTTVINMSNEKTKTFSRTMLIWFPIITITALITLKIGLICYDNGLDISESILKMIMVTLFIIVYFSSGGQINTSVFF